MCVHIADRDGDSLRQTGPLRGLRGEAAGPRSEARSGALHLAMSNEVDLAARTCRTHVVVTPDAGTP